MLFPLAGPFFIARLPRRCHVRRLHPRRVRRGRQRLNVCPEI